MNALSWATLHSFPNSITDTSHWRPEWISYRKHPHDTISMCSALLAAVSHGTRKDGQPVLKSSIDGAAELELSPVPDHSSFKYAGQYKQFKDLKTNGFCRVRELFERGKAISEEDLEAKTKGIKWSWPQLYQS